MTSDPNTNWTYTELCNQLENVYHEEDDKLNKMMDELVEVERTKDSFLKSSQLIKLGGLEKSYKS